MSRDAPAGRIEAIAERIAELDLVSAIRRIDACHPDAPRPGAALGVADEPLRLSQSVGLGFAATPLASLARRDGPARGRHDWRLHCRWLGLFGANGALPLHFTEYADRRARHHADPTFGEFADLFNHRLIGLFYRASTQFDPCVEGDKPDGDRLFGEILGALGGRAPSGARGRDALDERFAAFQAGWFGARTRTPDGLVALVRDYFDLPCRVRELVGGWLTLPPGCRVRLGRPARAGRGAGTPVALGRSAQIGRRSWSIGHAMVLRLGPLTRDDYLTMRPGGARARRLHDLVRNYLGDEIEWSVELELEPDAPMPLRVDGRAALGFTSWLGDRRRVRCSRPRRIPSRVCARGPIEAPAAPSSPPVRGAPVPERNAELPEDDPFDALEASVEPDDPAINPFHDLDDPFADFPPDVSSDAADEPDDGGDGGDTRLQGPRP